MTGSRSSAVARGAAGLLLALLAALAVLAHHELTGVPERAGAAAHMQMDRAPHAASWHSAGERHGGHDGHGSHSCALDGRMCTAQGVSHAYAPAVPSAALPVPVTPAALLFRAAAPSTGPPDPPHRSTVLRI